ncbi:hypothetical protein [Pseudomonas sp. Marseille-Q5115]|uniref:DUF7338 family protein n=1 Tax=Pseudomonas sp. Marseille-Q5115 TaxID=2866593 RepID=UPI001CE472F9|nr:hypothetical protein [Pseudomonas sp. Marseille-Q5115]
MTTFTASPAVGWRALLLPAHLVLFIPQFVVLLPLRIGFILAGFVAVPLALPFRQYHADTAVPFSQYPGTWQLVTLPRWAWPWSNDRDGAMGDKRGWWHANAPFGLGADHWLSMLIWLAYRNPANNLRFTKLFGCPVLTTTCTWWGSEVVEDDPGKGGVRFLVATSGLFPFYGLYWVRQWNATRALVVQLGFKGEPSDWAEDYAGDEQRQWKGFTCELNPFKNIG